MSSITTTLAAHDDDQQVKDQSLLLHRSFTQTPDLVTSCTNLTLTLSTGRPILDACGGAAVSCLGYSPTYLKRISHAISNQILSVPYVHTLTYTTTAAEQLASQLLSNNTFGLSKAYFVSSGSEAMDAALKLSRQYFYEIGERERVCFIGRRQSYHGNTIGSMSVGSHVARKAPYLDEGVCQLPSVSWVGPAYWYQYGNEGETEEQYAGRLVRELEVEICRVGEKRVVAFVAETVVGATTGCVCAPKGYFRGVKEVCERYGVLLILDEVMCGMGRTGSKWAFEQEGVCPDVVTFGKGLGGGFAAVAGVAIGEKVREGIESGSGNVAHGQTYQAHPVSCATALEVGRIVEEDRLIERCKKMGIMLEMLLREKLQDCKYVGDIRGRGLFWGVEFVKDKKTRQPFDASLQWGINFQQEVYAKGVAVYPGSGTKDGISGDHVIVSPAYTVKVEELETIVSTIRQVYDEMEREYDARGTTTNGDTGGKLMNGVEKAS